MAIKNIEPNLRLISDYTKLKKDEIFCIPAYQRAYSWTTIQCDKLWQDIESYIETGADDPYFFGTIIIDCSTDNCLNLIDGQQRTTTFLLLLKALLLRIGDVRNAMKESDETRSLKRGLRRSQETILEILYKADDDKQTDIEECWKNARGITILRNESINELYKNDLQTIIEAETYVEAEKNVHRTQRKQKDNKYTNFFRNFKYFYEKLLEYSESRLNDFAKTFLSKCQVIEIKSWQIEQAITMFNSLNSTGMPLSDADIISAQLYSKTNDKDRNDFIEQWQRINNKTDDLSRKKVITIDSVLQQFMYLERARAKEYKNNEVTTPGIRKYYTYERTDLLNEPKKLCDAYEKIVLIWEKISDYTIIKLLLKFNENFKLFLIPYLYRYDVDDISETAITPIAESLLRMFSIMEVGDIGYSASKFKSFLFNENLKQVNAGYSETEIANDFENHIRNSWKECDIIDDLKEYDKNILVFLNEYLYAKGKGIPFSFEPSTNVEHIMPASGHNIRTIQADAGIETAEEFDELANQLGNKILLEEDINKSISNDWFKTKKGHTITNKGGYRGSHFGLAKELSLYPKDTWTKEDIEEYTDKASHRIANFIFNK